MFSCKFAAYFESTFLLEQLWGAASKDIQIVNKNEKNLVSVSV